MFIVSNFFYNANYNSIIFTFNKKNQDERRKD